TDGHCRETHLNQTAFAKHLDEGAHSTALNEYADESGKCEQVADFFCSERGTVMRKATLREQGKSREESAECKGESEELPQQRPELRIFKRLDQRFPAGLPAPLELGMRRRYNRGKQEIRTHDAGKRQRCCGEDRICIVELGEISGDPG